MTITKACEACGTVFSRRVYQSRVGRTRFCSVLCGASAMNGGVIGGAVPKQVGDEFVCLDCRGSFRATPLILSSGKSLCGPCCRARKRDHRSKRKDLINSAHRDWIKANRSKASGYMNRWQSKNPQKVAAHRAVLKAVKAGELRRLPCADCGATEHIHGHHEDYARPLDVTWLCRACHMKRHRKTA